MMECRRSDNGAVSWWWWLLGAGDRRERSGSLSCWSVGGGEREGGWGGEGSGENVNGCSGGRMSKRLTWCRRSKRKEQ